MSAKKPGIASSWTDPDDAPSLSQDWFAHAEIRDGGRLIRPASRGGRPRASTTKQAVSLRLDSDLVEHYRATGPGWQTRINAALRKAAGL